MLSSRPAAAAALLLLLTGALLLLLLLPLALLLLVWLLWLDARAAGFLGAAAGTAAFALATGPVPVGRVVAGFDTFVARAAVPVAGTPTPLVALPLTAVVLVLAPVAVPALVVLAAAVSADFAVANAA